MKDTEWGFPTVQEESVLAASGAVDACVWAVRGAGVRRVTTGWQGAAEQVGQR